MLNIIKKCLQHKVVTNKYPIEKVQVGKDFLGNISVDTSKCTVCQKCIDLCPTKAIYLQDEIRVNIGKCIFCRLCIENCPNESLKIDNDYEIAVFDKTELGKYEESTTFREADIEVIGSKVEGRIKELFGRSFNIREVDAGSCNGCDTEVSIMNNPFNDLERFGIHFVASPRHADALLVTGCVSRNMEEALIKTYNATPDPKLVIAVGACAIDGGIFRGSYAVTGGVDQVIPVDLYIPGCPPRPQSIMYGIFKLLGRVQR